MLKFIARLERTVVNDEVVEVRLYPLRFGSTVHLNGDDEFVTIEMVVDPWKR